MPDREKVIKAWETVLIRDPLDVAWDLIDDTITLLKGQEPVEPTYEMIYDNKIPFCGICDTYLNFKMRFCPMCGRAVKWE